jgi:starvation-inducible DNA-binding protein
MIKELLGDHESSIINLRKGVDVGDEKFKDVGTADFLTRIMEDHETIAWKLRRYLD